MNIRKITHQEKLRIEDAIKLFGTLDLQGGSREERDGKIIYNLSFYDVHLKSTSESARKIGAILKRKLGADEIWMAGSRIA